MKWLNDRFQLGKARQRLRLARWRRARARSWILRSLIGRALVKMVFAATFLGLPESEWLKEYVVKVAQLTMPGTWDVFALSSYIVGVGAGISAALDFKREAEEDPSGWEEAAFGERVAQLSREVELREIEASAGAGSEASAKVRL